MLLQVQSSVHWVPVRPSHCCCLIATLAMATLRSPQTLLGGVNFLTSGAGRLRPSLL
ncbi:unnamed protein product [Staurois parvus]|uniref:Uncharacterized protein n=1 Tax=Staurois parvus TaxID=386267 RepID=A0ABN9BN27_9NEOB|nr:unnamed protein product [Staurois parvus]